MEKIYQKIDTFDPDAFKKAVIKHAAEPGLANGWKFEIYLSIENCEKGHFLLSFSEPMTQNSWTNDPEKIGSYEFFAWSDWEGVTSVCLKDGTYTDWVQFAQKEYDEETQKRQIEMMKKEYDNIDFCDYYDREEKTENIDIMQEDEYIDLLVISENFYELDEMVEKIENHVGIKNSGIQ